MALCIHLEYYQMVVIYYKQLADALLSLFQDYEKSVKIHGFPLGITHEKSQKSNDPVFEGKQQIFY